MFKCSKKNSNPLRKSNAQSNSLYIFFFFEIELSMKKFIPPPVYITIECRTLRFGFNASKYKYNVKISKHFCYRKPSFFDIGNWMARNSSVQKEIIVDRSRNDISIYSVVSSDIWIHSTERRLVYQNVQSMNTTYNSWWMK